MTKCTPQNLLYLAVKKSVTFFGQQSAQNPTNLKGLQFISTPEMKRNRLRKKILKSKTHSAFY